MRFALEAGALGTWEWDVETDACAINVRWAEMRGFAPGKLRPHYTHRHPDDEACLQPLAGAVRGGRIDFYEVDYRTPDRRGESRVRRRKPTAP